MPFAQSSGVRSLEHFHEGEAPARQSEIARRYLSFFEMFWTTLRAGARECQGRLRVDFAQLDLLRVSRSSLFSPLKVTSIE